MMLSVIKNKLYLLKGRRLHFKYNGSRNQIEEFYGYINEYYSNVFLITVDGSDIKKSFSYNDILINKLIILDS